MNYRSNMLGALLLASCIMVLPIAGQNADAQMASSKSPTTSKKTTKKSSIEAQIEEMRQQFQTQIDQLKQQLKDRDQQLQQAQEAAKQAQKIAQQAQQTAESAAGENNPAYTNLKQQVQSVQAASQKAVQEAVRSSQEAKAIAQKSQDTLEAVRVNEENMRLNYGEPIAMKYKGVDLVPGGFLAAETVERQRATGGGLDTAFNSIPFTNSAMGQQSEFIATGRQSRIQLEAKGKYDDATIGGYYEADFLNAGSSSNSNESNSYALRQRQVWARWQSNNGWTVVGGQMWSYLTLDYNGMENRFEAIPLTVDPQYVPGFIWTRQYGFRVYKSSFNKKLFTGIALEDPQTTFGGQGYTNNFVLGTAGNPAGLLNPNTNYSLNLAPDIIVKIAAEPGFGHYEVSGFSTFLRDRVYPNASTKSANGAYNDSKVAGGVEAAAWLPFAQSKANIGVRGFYGQSIGRYGSGGLPDTTVHPDGTLAPLHGLVALFSAEFHPNPKKLDIYEYYGGDYAGRAAYLNASGKPVGYGSPLFINTGCETETVPTSSPYGPGGQANCANDTRAIINETVGAWYHFYDGPKGKLLYGLQYDYAQRKTWAGVGGGPTAKDNMFFTSFRYYVP